MFTREFAAGDAHMISDTQMDRERKGISDNDAID